MSKNTQRTQNAVALGRKAFKAGRSIDCNPFGKGDRSGHQSFRAGYLEAKDLANSNTKENRAVNKMLEMVGLRKRAA